MGAKNSWEANGVKVTLGGKAGAGTTTIGKALAEALAADFQSGGTIMRGFCARLGITDAEFKERRIHDSKWDRQLDDEQRRLGRIAGDLVLESRLGWFFVPHSLKVLIVCDESVRIERLVARARANGSVETPEQIAQRECGRDASDHALYARLYGIEDYLDPDHYGLCIDSGRLDVAACVAEIRKHPYLRHRR